jgi:hypothetical protein
MTSRQEAKLYLLREVDPVIKGMLAQLVRHRPSDVVSFMIDFLTDLRARREGTQQVQGKPHGKVKDKEDDSLKSSSCSS